MHAALDAARLGQANCQADHNDAHSQQQLNARDEDFVTITVDENFCTQYRRL